MDKVALSKEVQLLQNYIELEKLRYGDKLKMEADIRIENEGLLVAPLLLLPFAENCFKHGGAGADGVFMIRIQLLTDYQKLAFHISNSRKQKGGTTVIHGGVGLENIRQRLTLLYPGMHQLTIQDNPESYSVRLEIKFKDDDV
jgi:LytS/YehU family sensor histidine kinase